ncbi:MAG: deoxynucleoside kinase [Anaerolineae bacterium]|nr:deoxynucleoside kinase [Anaerolineae bacterium]
MNTTQVYITIEGVIGVGKTTLARMFQKEIDAQLVLEVFEENPFLSDFYGDRTRYAFQTQIFFLLSRYHQQRQISALPRPIISDYMFEKDRLFAQVNLDGDEFDTYNSVHEALAENTPLPDLVVYLKADTDTLMNRITARDRPYERNMDSDYINSLRIAYDQLFSSYKPVPVITIDTNAIDFVQNPEDREAVFNRIRGAIGQGPRQPALPGLGNGEPALVPSAGHIPPAPAHASHRISDFQQLHRELEHDHQPSTDPLLYFLLLQEEIGGLAHTFAQHRITTQSGQTDAPSPPIKETLADVLAHVIRLANTAGVDLEEAYLHKMNQAQARKTALSTGK